MGVAKGARITTSSLSSTRNVLVVCHDLDAPWRLELENELRILGYWPEVVTTAIEAIWHLERVDLRFVAVIVDGDHDVAERVELLEYLGRAHSSLARLLLVAAPLVELDEQVVIIDKDALHDTLAQALGVVLN